MRHLLNFLYTGQTCLREAEIQELRELIKMLDIKTDIWDEPSLPRGPKNGLSHDKLRNPPNGIHSQAGLRDEIYDYSSNRYRNECRGLLHILLNSMKIISSFFFDLIEELQVHVDENSSSMEDSPGLHISPEEHAEDGHSPNHSPPRRSISNRRRSSLNPVNLTVEKNHRRNSVDDKHSSHNDDHERVSFQLFADYFHLHLWLTNFQTFIFC